MVRPGRASRRQEPYRPSSATSSVSVGTARLVISGGRPRCQVPNPSSRAWRQDRAGVLSTSRWGKAAKAATFPEGDTPAAVNRAPGGAARDPARWPCTHVRAASPVVAATVVPSRLTATAVTGPVIRP